MRLALLVLAVARTSLAQPADWTVHRDPFDPDVIAKYRQLLARDPYDATAFDRLVRLYRAYRTVAALEAAYEPATDRASFVIRARLRRDRGDLAGARELLAQALAANTDDARGWLELAGLDRKLGDAASARADYDRAVALAPPPRLAEPALRALVELARDAGDADAIAAYSDRRAQLAPREAAVRLERGDAELAVGRPERAAASYAEAEARAARDPERRREAIERRGVALERNHDELAAVAAYRRALELAPKGSGLAHQLVGRIVDSYRRRDALREVADQLARLWPERTRGFFEWQTLGSIYLELADDEARTSALQWVDDHDAAVAALTRAVRAGPWEVVTARRLAGLLEAAGRLADALAIYRDAVRAAPGDAALAIELAERTWPTDEAGALAIVARAAKLVDRDPARLADIADAYARHGRYDLAQRTREQVVRLDPSDEAHWIALAEAYLAADDPAGAVAAWHRAGRPTANALLRFGERLLAEHAAKPAVRVFGDAIDLDPRDPAAWRGSASALALDGVHIAAIEHALHALELTPPDRQARHVARHFVVATLNDVAEQLGDRVWSAQLRGWAAAFSRSPPDLGAGYLLLEAYDDMMCDTLIGRTSDRSAPCKTGGAIDFARVIDAMARLVPDDFRVQEVQARSLADRGEIKRALARYREIGRLFPQRAKVVEAAIADAVRANPWIDPYIDPPPTYLADAPPLPRLRLGAELGGAISLRGAAAASPVVGARAVYGIAGPFALTARLDATRRGDVNAIGESVGLAARLATTPAFALAAGASEHVELRLGDSPGRLGVAGELELDLAFRGAPVALGARVERWLLGGIADTRGVLAISVELR